MRLGKRVFWYAMASLSNFRIHLESRDGVYGSEICLGWYLIIIKFIYLDLTKVGAS